VATTAFQIPVGKRFVWELGSSYMFGQDFQKSQIRPFTSFSIQINDKTAKKMKDQDNVGRFYVQFTPEMVWSQFTSGGDKLLIGQSLGAQTSLFTGVRVGEKSTIGFFGSIGSNNKDVTQKIVDLYTNSTDTINTSYNPYHAIAFGAYVFQGKMRISYGMGALTYNEGKNSIPYQSFTIGASLPIYKDMVRLNLDVSTKMIDNSFDNIMFGIIPGISLRYSIGR
jgi:hypothetical protein